MMPDSKTDERGAMFDRIGWDTSREIGCCPQAGGVGRNVRAVEPTRVRGWPHRHGPQLLGSVGKVVCRVRDQFKTPGEGCVSQLVGTGYWPPPFGVGQTGARGQPGPKRIWGAAAEQPSG
jgi:hypothetical protein